MLKQTIPVFEDLMMNLIELDNPSIPAFEITISIYSQMNCLQ